MTRGFLLCLMVPAFAGAAQAGPFECDTIRNAFRAAGDVPGYRQVMDITAPHASRMEFVVIGETVYAHLSGKWTRIRMPPGKRPTMVSSILDKMTISECTEQRAETLPAGRMKVFRYTMTPAPEVPGAPVVSEIWIGVADGLVHRVVSPGMQIDLDFRTQIPPIP